MKNSKKDLKYKVVLLKKVYVFRGETWFHTRTLSFFNTLFVLRIEHLVFLKVGGLSRMGGRHQSGQTKAVCGVPLRPRVWERVTSHDEVSFVSDSST